MERGYASPAGAFIEIERFDNNTPTTIRSISHPDSHSGG